MKRLLAALSLLSLAACGADGEPVRPTASSSITMSSSGVSVGTAVGLRRGPFSVSLGAGS
ncbi:hypothetical protein HKX17_12715 [Sulfitobacter sp. KE34]|uniref:Argininosuccinate lyase n=1 Tax=Sulfitobacter faviae TaxID=1775881 RepID=A0AAX3LR13_9RHOB|nr:MULTISPECIES: hypothetical protein [Sulfitobacter]MDF3351017.1 hypothetical protein [Sulfitobacter sp. KE12]MDF3354689.1 hypothetical protein [Sulfitobacter sp. KE27]MDF3358337.1 hypothetical protein [Sulfitobacter sp. KE33]MDF3361117.1 hypothetical protein [Sulfitobacter sp. Ks41]MDF3365761.1 hypothetical protein [Sulfitobacter sp. Ks34]